VSALILTKTKSSSLSRLAIARSCGITALHGVHHVTPTSSTTTFPRSQSAPGSGSGALRNGAHRWNQQVVEGSGGTSNRSQTEPRCNSLQTKQSRSFGERTYGSTSTVHVDGRSWVVGRKKQNRPRQAPGTGRKGGGFL